MATQAARFVGSIPEQYDRGLGPHLFAVYAEDLARRTAAMAPNAVLELAAGTGIASRALRDALADPCELVVSDLNPPMLDVARSKFRAGEAVHFEEADATELPFAEGRFDVVVCQFGVMFFPDKARSYREVRRVLRPAGRYLFNVWDSWDANPFARIAHETVERFFPDDPPAFYRVPFGYRDPEEIGDALRDAGFAEVKLEALPTRAKIASSERFAHGLVFGNPLLEEIESRGGDPEAVRDAIAQALDREFDGEMSLQAIVVEARRG